MHPWIMRTLFKCKVRHTFIYLTSWSRWSIVKAIHVVFIIHSLKIGHLDKGQLCPTSSRFGKMRVFLLFTFDFLMRWKKNLSHANNIKYNYHQRHPHQRQRSSERLKSRIESGWGWDRTVAHKWHKKGEAWAQHWEDKDDDDYNFQNTRLHKT